MADSNSKTTSSGPGHAASPLIDQQIQKDWGGNKKSYTSGDEALANKHTKNPVKTGDGSTSDK